MDAAALRARLLDRARSDEAIVGAAITGSAARGAEDRWSDVDLFFGVEGAVLEHWTSYVYGELGAVHHFDLVAGRTVYRAFLLGGGLEIDLGFAPADEFGPAGDGAFEVVFGTAVPRRAVVPRQSDHVIGLSWHHVLHARTSIERGSGWQAEYWISALRDHFLELACVRSGLPTTYGKGADRLPGDVLGLAGEALVRGLGRVELERALRAAVTGFVRELRLADPGVAQHLVPVVERLAAGPEGLTSR